MSVAIPWTAATNVQAITAVSSAPTGVQCLGGPLSGALLDFRIVNSSTTLVAAVANGATAAAAAAAAVLPVTGTQQGPGCSVLGPLETAFVTASPASFWSASASSTTQVYVQGGMGVSRS